MKACSPRRRRREASPRGVMQMRAAVSRSGKADASEYAAWAKNADSLRSWDGDVETMHEWYRIDYDDRGLHHGRARPHNKEGPGRTADVAWEDVTRICFHVGGPPASSRTTSTSKAATPPPGDTERGAHERPTARQKDHGEPASWGGDAPEQFMIKLVEKRALHRRTVYVRGPRSHPSGPKTDTLRSA